MELSKWGNLEVFEETADLLNVYMEEKLMNNFLLAWLQLKELLRPKIKTKFSQSNIIGTNNKFDISRQHRRFKTNEDQLSYGDFEQESTPQHSQAEMKETDIIKDLESEQQFEDIVLQRLSELEEQVSTIKRKYSHKELIGKKKSMGKQNKQEEAKRLGLSPKYINLSKSAKSFIKQESFYEVSEGVDNPITEKTIPKLSIRGSNTNGKDIKKDQNANNAHAALTDDRDKTIGRHKTQSIGLSSTNNFIRKMKNQKEGRSTNSVFLKGMKENPQYQPKWMKNPQYEPDDHFDSCTHENIMISSGRRFYELVPIKIYKQCCTQRKRGLTSRVSRLPFNIE